MSVLKNPVSICKTSMSNILWAVFDALLTAELQSIRTAAILSSHIDLSKTIICADLAVMVTDGLLLPLCFAALSLS